MPRPPAVLLVLTLLAAARAAAAAPNDREFVLDLLDRGYSDLAREAYARTAPDALLEAPILLAEAAQARTPGAASERLAAAVAVLDKFRSSPPAAKDLDAAEAILAEAHRRRALLAASSLPAETDAGRAAVRRGEAADAWTAAEGVLQASLSRHRAAEEPLPACEVTVSLARARLAHARLPGLEPAERTRLLDASVRDLAEARFDAGMIPPAYETLWIEGLCHAERGDFALAEQRLRGALELRTFLRDAKPEPPAWAREVVHGATLDLARTLRRAGRPAEAAAAAEEAFRTEPDLERERAGAALRLEEARDLAAQQNAMGALALARRALEADGGAVRPGPLATEALELIRSLAGAAGGPADPTALLAAADASLRAGRRHEAAQAFRRTLDCCRAPADAATYAPAAWSGLGRCWAAAGLRPEAAIAFETAALRYPASPPAPEACFEAARCHALLEEATGDPDEGAASDRCLAALPRLWPSHPLARASVSIHASRLERRAEAAPPPDRAARWREAAAKYLEVPDDAGAARDEALYRAAAGLYAAATASVPAPPADTGAGKAVRADLTLAEKTLGGLLDRLRLPPGPGDVPEAARRRADLRVASLQKLAQIRIHDAIGRPEEALAAADEATGGLSPDDARLAPLWELRTRALLRLGRHDEAIEAVDLLLARFPRSREATAAARTAAIRLHEAAEALPTDTSARLRKASLRFFGAWIAAAPPASIPAADACWSAAALAADARRLSGLDAGARAVTDPGARAPSDRASFAAAAESIGLLLGGKTAAPSADDRIAMGVALARCRGFAAATAADWKRAKEAYAEVVRIAGLEDDAGHLIPASLTARRHLLAVYAELGAAHVELGKRGQPFQYDNALTLFAEVLRVTQTGSAPWWEARWRHAAAFVARGAAGDIESARIEIDNLEMNNPHFAGAPPAVKSALEALSGEIGKTAPREGRSGR